VRPQPPVPAEVDVTFHLSTALPRAIAVPAETAVSTEATDDGESVGFATVESLTIEPPSVLAVRVWRQGQAFEDYQQYLTSELLDAPSIFNEEPQEGDALYIGHAGDLAGHALQIRLECASDVVTHIDPKNPPLRWEYWSRRTGDWAPLLLLDESGTGRIRGPDDPDPTRGLNEPGTVHLHVPNDSAPTTVDEVEATWIRVRYILLEGQGYDRSPRIDGIRSEVTGATVRARHAALIEEDVLGISDGEPGQRFTVREAPVLRSAEPHVIEARLDDGVEDWTEVPDFSSSRDGDRHFVFDHARGEVQFGPFIRERDGSARQLGSVPRRDADVVLRAYRVGGGLSGNVGQGTVTQLASSVPYVTAVMNYEGAFGGLDAESLEETKLRALSVLKHTESAITTEDYERLAVEVPGIGRAACSQDGTPGRVRLALIPDLPGPRQPLEPDDLQLPAQAIEAVSAHLDERKILGTIIDYERPEYTFVDVDGHFFVSAGEDVEAVRTVAEIELRRFMHPLLGGRDGRGAPFGGAITESQIAGILQSVPGVAYVERTRLRAQGADGDASRIAADAGGMLLLGSLYLLAEPAGA
jgi:predicted phage baseplate assembly protein